MTQNAPTETRSDDVPAARRRLRTTVASSLIFVFVLLLAAAATGLWWRYGETLREGERRTETVAALVAENLTLRFEALETGLFQLAAHGRLIGGPSASMLEWLPVLKAVHSGLAGITSISVTDDEGTVTASTQPMSMGFSYGDSRLHDELSANPMSDALVFGALARDPVEGRVYMPAGRVLRTTAGEFEGMLVALVEPAALGAVYAPLADDAEAVLRIFDADSQPLVPAPTFTDPLDRPPPEVPIGQNSGVITEPIADGGEPYVTAFRQVEGSGVTVAVSLARSALLAPWWREATAVLATVALAGLLMLFAGIRIVRAAQ